MARPANAFRSESYEDGHRYVGYEAGVNATLAWVDDILREFDASLDDDEDVTVLVSVEEIRQYIRDQA